MLPQIADKLGKLVSTGKSLIASAASSITNPIKESGSLMLSFGKDLAGFAKS